MRTINSHLSWVALAIAGAAACANGPDVSAETSGVTVRDSAGIEIVENSGAGPPEGERWTIGSTPAVSIGAVNGAPEEEFGRVVGATRLSDGRVVVLDDLTGDLRYFSPSGEHLSTTGGKGEGPGEVASPWALVRLPADSILVEDFRFGYVVFAPDGSLVREERFDQARISALDMTALCLVQFRFPDRSRIGCRELGSADSAAVLSSQPELSAPGLDRDGYHRIVWANGGLDGAVETALGARVEYHDALPGPHPLFAAHVVTGGGNPPRLFSALNPAYSIEVWTPEGRLERIIRRLDALRGVDDALGGEVRTWYQARYGDDRERWRRFEEEVPIPEYAPAVLDMTSNDRGELMVRRWLLPETLGPGTWDAFDAAGRFVGALDFPARFRVVDFGEDYVLGVRMDELDVSFVELWRLERPADGRE